MNEKIEFENDKEATAYFEAKRSAFQNFINFWEKSGEGIRAVVPATEFMGNQKPVVTLPIFWLATNSDSLEWEMGGTSPRRRESENIGVKA